MAFVKAVKVSAKIRMALAGPSGSGKTYTALTLATALADGQPVAVIDTERGSASKYSDLFSFDVMELDSFHPDTFTAGIQEAAAAGYAVLVIDSLSHAWNGTGGLLEIVESIAKRSKSNSSFNAWGEATPIQNRMIEAITRSKMHIIVTMRSKQEYILETNSNGKTVPRKVGMAPVQRGDLEYEFDIFGEMDYDNNLIIQKSRCPALSGAVIGKPDSQVADVLKSWLSGVPVPMPTPADIAAIRNEVGAAFAFKDEEFETRWSKCKATILGRAVADPDLTSADISKIRTYTEHAKNKTAGGGR